MKQHLSHIENYLVLAIVLTSLFLRVYKLDSLLGFYFDQGRDGLVIRDLLKKGEPFLVGPVTGLEGIFLGPSLYYAITPFYWIGSGNPIVPAYFMAGIQIFTLYFLYRFGKTISPLTGILTIFLYGLSQPMISLSRWLSNPPPLMICSAGLAYALLKISKGEVKYWILASILIALGLQFEVASAAFLLLAIPIFLLWQWKNRPTPKIAIISILLFLVFLTPQLLFELRNNFLMSRNIYKELIQKQSFQESSLSFAINRINLYKQVFGSKLFGYDQILIDFAFTGLLIFGLLTFKFWSSVQTKIILLLITPQLILFLFFRGNHGNVYDYHFSGSFPLFILLVGIWISTNKNKLWSRTALSLMLALFLWANIPLLLKTYRKDPFIVTIDDQKKATMWVYGNSAGNKFNLDVYVPPVIPYSYQYLFLWIGDKFNRYPSQDSLNLLYTLHEIDPENPERLNLWLERQLKIGKIEEQINFGPITVERRTRF